MQSRGRSPEPGEQREKGKRLRQARCCSSRRQDLSLLAGSEAAQNYQPEICHGKVLELKSQGEGPELEDCSLLVGRAGRVPLPQPLAAQRLQQIPAAQHGQGCWGGRSRVTRRGGKKVQKQEPCCQMLHVQHIWGSEH